MTRARGQTTIDFALGAGIFLVVLAFVVSFVPGMFAPFQDPDNTQEADRVATALSTSALTTGDGPYRLDADCTVEFFAQMQGDGSASNECSFDTSTTTLSSTLGVRDPVTLNVTVEPRAGGGYIDVDGRDFRAGPTPPNRGSVSVARRVVLYDGHSYRLVVRAW